MPTIRNSISKIASILPSLLLLAFFLLPSPLEASFFDPKMEMRTVKTSHFYIHYSKDIGPVAQDLLEIVEKVHDRLTEKYRWKPWGRTHVVLVDKTDQANGLATVIPANYLLLYVSPPDADSSLDHYRDYLELLFTHEYTHILHIDQHHRLADPFHWVLGKIIAPNGLTPGWMREGMAALEETEGTGKGRGNSSYTEMVLRTRVLEDNFPKIDEVAGLGSDWPASDTQYLFGVKFWQWLAEKYGEDRMQRYMEEYSSSLWLFSLNNKARRVYGKSFYKLWRDWEAELKEKYSSQEDELSAQGLTPLAPLAQNKDLLSYPTPHPSGKGYAYVRAGQDEGHKIIIEREAGSDPVILRRAALGQLSYSRDEGSLLAFSSLSSIEKYRTYSEVYLYDFEGGSVKRLYEEGEGDKTMRATDPDFSPLDGGALWILMVRTSQGTDNLYLYNLETKKGFYLTHAPKYTQFSNPRFSPDGTWIVVSRKDHRGNRDIVLYTKSGREVVKLTHDEADDLHPTWSPSGRYIYFDSDKNGISNIYRHDLYEGQTVRVTNVLTGVYQPQSISDGEEIYVKGHTSKGPDLYVIERASLSEMDRQKSKYRVDWEAAHPEYVKAVKDREKGKTKKKKGSPRSDLEDISHRAWDILDYWDPVNGYASNPFLLKEMYDKPTPLEELVAGKEPPQVEAVEIEGSKKYNAYPQVLVPRYIIPTFATLDDAFLGGVAIGRFDPLYRHNWNIYTNYRTDAAFLGGGASYVYTRYNPNIYIGGIRYVLNWGDLFQIGSDFFEQRTQGYIGTSLGLGKHSLSLNYFYEDRDNLTSGLTFANLDTYAGVHLAYSYARYKQFRNSISRESGPYFKLTFDMSDSLFGSAEVNEQSVVTGDLRYYFEMPWSDHHVLGIRGAGGFVWGDREFSGSFRFGGPFGEGALAGYSSRLFPFRGMPGVTFAGDRVLLFNTEYRLPLAIVDRGIGTWPFFLRQLHLSFFADYGDIWARGGKDGRSFFEDFFLGVGGEFKSDLVLGYGLPVTARLGYAIVVLNSDQLTGLNDPTFGNDIRNGTYYLQFGTSF